MAADSASLVADDPTARLARRAAAAAEFAAEMPHLEQFDPTISFYAGRDDSVRVSGYLGPSRSWEAELAAIVERFGPPEIAADFGEDRWRLVWHLPKGCVLSLAGGGVDAFIDRPSAPATFRAPDVAVAR